ncbi:DNA primase [Candidatus Woesebacteria bacterium]|nr:DNA primase [Candidatus Woesebacteria bacterium]
MVQSGLMTGDVEEVKSRSDIVAIVGGRVQLKKAGRNFRGLCPFHQEKTPSFMVSPELQIYKCFGCGESGDVFSFLEKSEGMDFREALKYLADKAGVKLASYTGEDSEKEKLYEINSLAAKFYNYVLLNHKAGKIALDYLLKERGLTLDTIKEFNLGFSSDSPDALKKFLVDKKKYNPKDLELAGLAVLKGSYVIDRFRGRVIFPVFDHRGNIVGFSGRVLPGGRDDLAKYVNTPETPVYHKSDLLFALNKTRDFIKKKGVAIVVEGQLDAISTWQIGIKNVVAVGGTAFTLEQVKLLSRFCQKMILCLDADSAGGAAEVRGISIAFNQGFEIKVAKLPVGAKDPDDAARKTPVEFKNSLINSVGIWDFLIDLVFSKYDSTTGSGKSKISREVVPILKSIDDEIVSNHYINLVAKRLDVTVESVSKEVEKPKETFLHSKQVEESIALETTKNRRTLIEERILTIAFQTFPDRLLEKYVSDLITTPLAKRIIEEFQIYSKDNHEFNISKFGRSLPKELFKGFAEMALKDVDVLTQDARSLSLELDLSIKELEIVDIRRKLEEIGVKIRQLEQDNDPEQLQKAQTQFSELAQKLFKLEEEAPHTL